jgi:hypothetical protein
MNAVIRTLAEYRAKQRVRDQIRKEGHKLYSYKAREITELARTWLDAHLEQAVAEAMADVERSPELKKMYLKEEKRLGRPVAIA